jgi:hypothetical protein
MIKQMHYMGHPIMVLQNEFEITVNNDERLIQAAREEEISPDCFLRGAKKNIVSLEPPGSGVEVANEDRGWIRAETRPGGSMRGRSPVTS